MFLEIKEFPSDLDGGEVEKVPHRLHPYICQGAVKAEETILKNIVCCLPPSQTGIAPEHLSSEFEEPLACMIQ